MGKLVFRTIWHPIYRFTNRGLQKTYCSYLCTEDRRGYLYITLAEKWKPNGEKLVGSTLMSYHMLSNFMTAYQQEIVKRKIKVSQEKREKWHLIHGTRKTKEE